MIHASGLGVRCKNVTKLYIVSLAFLYTYFEEYKRRDTFFSEIQDTSRKDRGSKTS